MYGVERAPAAIKSRGDQRKNLLTERDERIVKFMQQQRPIVAIAKLEGLALDYCRKACQRLAAEHGIDYNPTSEETPVGLTDASRHFRATMADILCQFRDTPGRHQLEVCTATGLTQARQVKATQRPNDHDWSLGELERLARATDQDFTVMMLRGLLSKEQFNKVIRCLNS